jgi:hypothetical protein
MKIAGRETPNRWVPCPATETLQRRCFFLLRANLGGCHAPGALTIRFTNYGMHCSGQISRDRNCYDVDEDGAKDESSRLEWDCCLLLAIT